MQFFMPMIPPSKTHQEKRVAVIKGKPVFYEPQELKTVRNKLMAHLAPFAPGDKMTGPVRLVVKWLFPVTGDHKNGEYKTTKPDTDNLQKMLKDCMTDCGFWKDDAQVVSEIVEKFYADISGIWISVTEAGPYG